MKSRSKGIVLDQLKEPAFSREIREFLNATPQSTIDSYQEVKDKQFLVPDEVLAVAEEANIIDERDGRLIAEKIREALGKGIKAVVADAIDDEPYISSQMSPMIHMQEEIVGGLHFVSGCFDNVDMFIAVYKNIYDLNTKIPPEIGGVRLEKVEGRYPVEFNTVKSLGEQTLVLGACSLIHLYRAVRQGKRQSTCFVTVAGNCIANPINLEVSIGVTVQQVLERCGLIDDPTRIIIGGPMTGLCVLHPDQTVVGVTTRAVLAFREDIKERQYVCIGCGNCVHCCPMEINPMWIYKMIEQKKTEKAKLLDIDMCVGCGTCSYVCPAKLNLSLVIFEEKKRLAKLERGEQP